MKFGIDPQNFGLNFDSLLETVFFFSWLICISSPLPVRDNQCPKTKITVVLWEIYKTE